MTISDGSGSNAKEQEYISAERGLINAKSIARAEIPTYFLSFRNQDIFHPRKVCKARRSKTRKLVDYSILSFTQMLRKLVNSKLTQQEVVFSAQCEFLNQMCLVQ